MSNKTLHFKSKAGYMRWLAYKNIHGLNQGNKDTIYLAGKKHKVNHSR